MIKDRDADLPEQVMWEGRFITAKTRGRWEYVGRARGIRAAAIIALDDDADGTRHVILVSQFRVPLGRFSLEIPAGLVGDDAGGEGEDAAAAAARELAEETGYRAARLDVLGEFYSSPGMVSECFTLLKATGLTRVGEGGGTEGENITVHRVALRDLARFVAEWRRAGHAVDVRIAMLLTPGYLGEDLIMAGRPKAGRVAGKLALVTGAAQGLGRAHCIRLAQEGARVLATDINAAGAAETAAIINAEMGAGTAFAIAHDVTDPAQWEIAVDAAREHLGGLSVLVNNAGIGVAGNIEACTFDDWQRCFDINVNSIFHGCQKALPLMREHAPGSIINISSIAGLIASDTMPAYNASKAAVWMLSKSIALHCAKKGMNIRSNSIHPTFVDTPILDGTAKAASLDRDVLLEKLARQIPLKFVGEPNDIANAVVYLASDESRFMTGAELKLDGGISAM